MIIHHVEQTDNKDVGDKLNDTVLTQYSDGSDDATVETVGEGKASDEINADIPHNVTLEDDDNSDSK